MGRKRRDERGQKTQEGDSGDIVTGDRERGRRGMRARGE